MRDNEKKILYENINKIEKHLDTLRKNEDRQTQITKIRNIKQDNTAYLTEIKDFQRIL